MKLRSRRATTTSGRRITQESASPTTSSKKRKPSAKSATSSKKRTITTIKSDSITDSPQTGTEKSSSTPQQVIDSLFPDDTRRQDATQLHDMIRRVAPELEPTLDFVTSSKMLGYGKYHYKYKSGREGDWVRVGLSCKKKSITLSCCGCVDGKYVLEKYQNRVSKSKKVHVGKSCIRFSDLEHLNMTVVEELIQATANSDIMQ